MKLVSDKLDVCPFCYRIVHDMYCSEPPEIYACFITLVDRLSLVRSPVRNELMN